MGKVKILLLACLLAMAGTAMAQPAYEAELEGNIKLAKHWQMSLCGEIRSADNMKGVERLTIGGSIGYRLTKNLKTDIGYLLIYRHFDERTTSKGNTVCSNWSPRHRYWLGVTGSVKAGRLEFALRERLQFTHRPLRYIPKYSGEDGHRMTDEEYSNDDELMLRSRLGVKWNIKHCPVTPFANVEMFNDTHDGWSVDQMRYIIGADYKLDKHNTLSLSYRYKNKSSDDDEPGSHLISVGYAHDF